MNEAADGMWEGPKIEETEEGRGKRACGYFTHILASLTFSSRREPESHPSESNFKIKKILGAKKKLIIHFPFIAIFSLWSVLLLMK